MQDSIADFVTHRNTGSLQLIQDLLIASVTRIGSRVYYHSHRNAGLKSADDLVRQRGILHEPERDIYSLSLVIDE